MSDLKTEGVTSVPESEVTQTAAPRTAIENLTTLPTEGTTTEPVREHDTVPATETPAVTEPTAATETPEAATVAADPELITEGEVGVKASFLPFLYQKRWIHFQDEPYADKDLHKYLEKEKNHQNSHHNYAHAVTTGKGLLFVSKSANDKTRPSYVFNLAGAEVTTTGTDKFAVKAANAFHDIHLEAKTAALRDSWVFTLRKEIDLATKALPAVMESEGYKTGLEKFAVKPAAVVPIHGEKKELKEEKKEEKAEEKATKSGDHHGEEEAAAGASAAAIAAEEHKHRKEEKEAAKEEKKEEKLEAKEEKKENKRSASKTRSRFSFFGGKKDEEKKEEAAKADTVAPISESVPIVPESSTDATTHPVADAAVIGAAGAGVIAAEEHHTAAEPESTKAIEEPIAATEPTTVTEPTTAGVVTPEPVSSPKSNRKSFLGGLGFGGKKNQDKVTPKEELAAAPLATEPMAAEGSSAPVVPVTEPLEPTNNAAETPAVVEPTSEETAPVPAVSDAVVEDEAAPVTTEASSSPVAKVSLVDNLLGKLKNKPAAHATITAEVEKLAHFGGSSSATEPTTEAATATESVPATEESAVAEASSPVVSPGTEKKSFLGFGGSKVGADGEAKPKRSFSLFGKNKKTSPASASTATEEPVAETEPATESAVTEPTAGAEEPLTSSVPETTEPSSEVRDGAIGDVVPSAVTVGEPSHVSATA